MVLKNTGDGVEEHRGGGRKTKCLKFWKSSVEFTRKNQRRLRRDELLNPRATSPDYGFCVASARTSDRTASKLKSLKGPLSIPLESGTDRDFNCEAFILRAHDE